MLSGWVGCSFSRFASLWIHRRGSSTVPARGSWCGWAVVWCQPSPLISPSPPCHYFITFWVFPLYFNVCNSHLVLAPFFWILSHFSFYFFLILFFFYHSSHLSPPFLGFSISQTPHHFSRCYDKPWLINSKASTPLRGFDYSDFQLPSAEVEYGLPAPGSCCQAGCPGMDPPHCPACP